MRFVQFKKGAQQWLGVVEGERVRALGPASLDDLISGGTNLTSFAHEAKAQGSDILISEEVCLALQTSV
jgi:hypothetical protein